MAALTLNGKGIITTRVVIPYYGTWVADVVLAATDNILLQSTLVLGDLSLNGNVYRMASFTGSRSARLVGGFGGWRKTLPQQQYQKDLGVKMSLVLGDAASIVGEQISVATDQTIGTFYTREKAPAERLLRQLAGPEWWIDTKGVTQIAAQRAGGVITSSFQVISWSGAKGQFEIASETLSDWMPGRVFSSANVTDPQTIGMTTITADNDGKLRVSVLATGVGSQ